jgi:CDP-paratose 2-epimerase
MRTILVTGGCGFVGSNLAAEALGRAMRVVVFDNLGRHGSTRNLQWLRSRGELEFFHGDTRHAEEVARAVELAQPDIVAHLAGQVAMTTSVGAPRLDFETNVIGTFNVLEALRRAGSRAALIYSSSNKVYGDLETIRLDERALRYEAIDFPSGIDERAPLDFRTPYGCSKGAADQYVLDYARSFGLRTAVFRHSTIYGGRQFATADQGWVGWFCRQALETVRDPGREPFTICGDGKQVRDLLHVSDAVNIYLTAAERIDEVAGEAFNIGGGPANSASLLELFAMLEERLRVSLRYRRLPWRANDQKYFVADIGKAERLLGWRPMVTRESGVDSTLRWERECASAAAAGPALTPER